MNSTNSRAISRPKESICLGDVLKTECSAASLDMKSLFMAGTSTIAIPSHVYGKTKQLPFAPAGRI
jgi:hypothetical protein